MKPTIVAGTLALAVLLWTGLAAANDVQGRVKAIEMTQKVITLDNGTRLFWTDDIPVADQLQSGDLVKARFEERGGRFVLTEIEIVEKDMRIRVVRAPAPVAVPVSVPPTLAGGPCVARSAGGGSPAWPACPCVARSASPASWTLAARQRLPWRALGSASSRSSAGPGGPATTATAARCTCPARRACRRRRRPRGRR